MEWRKYWRINIPTEVERTNHECIQPKGNQSNRIWIGTNSWHFKTCAISIQRILLLLLLSVPFSLLIQNLPLLFHIFMRVIIFFRMIQKYLLPEIKDRPPCHHHLQIFFIWFVGIIRCFQLFPFVSYSYIDSRIEWHKTIAFYGSKRSIDYSSSVFGVNQLSTFHSRASLSCSQPLNIFRWFVAYQEVIKTWNFTSDTS